MSLQLIAKQMEAKGREGDSMLVHMTPGEVAGLQKLAESAGGSLSVNPDTGLVEANFLKQMLPTLVGAGVGFFTANPMLGAAAGAAVGGYQANRAGQDVGAGMVMGGLGGYGGASLGSSLQAAGAPAVTGGAGAAGGGAASKTATNMATNAMLNQAMGGFTPAQQQAAIDQGNMLSPMDRMAPVPLQTPSTTAGTGAGAPNVQVPLNTQAAGSGSSGAPTKFSDMTYSQRLDRGLEGIKAFGTEEGRDKALQSLGGSEGVMRMLMMAGLPAMYGARTSVPHPYPLLSADVNKRGFADGGEVGFFTGGGTGQGGGLLSSLVANRPYIIDPATGNVIRNPNLPPPAAVTFANMAGSDGRDYVDPNPGWTGMTDAQKSAYYAENPTASAIAQAAQTYNPFASLQEYMDPGVTQRQGIIAAGLTPNQNFGVPGFDYSADYDSFASERAAVDRARPGLVDGGLQDPQQRAEMAAEAAASAGMAGASEGGAGSTAATAESPDGPDGANRGDSPGANTGADAVGRSESADNRAQGGLLGLAKGGMKSGGFVVPADVVSMVGEGNTDAGYKRIKSMVPTATAIKGKDGGQSDTVKTRIDGKQQARVAHGEMYIPPETVKRMGGAKKLYAMMDRVREQATGSKKQIKPVSLKRALA